MKIVIDANVFISAFFWGGIPLVFVDMVTDKLCTSFISDEIIKELERVIKKNKFPASEEEKRYKIQFIKQISDKITASERITTGGCRDKTDNKYLECAVAANADYIISGDKHLLELKEYRGIKIVNAAEYLQKIKI